MIYDLIIIGMGISGVTASLYAKKSNLNYVSFEKNKIGGILHKVNNIANYPGFTNVTGIELSEILEKQIKENNINVLYDEITKISKNDNVFNISTKDKTYITKNVLISTGRKIVNHEIKGENKYFGHGISKCAVCDGFFFKDKDVAVIGSSNKSIEDAAYLSDICSKVYFITNDKSITKFVQTNIEIIYNKNIDEFLGNDILLEKIKFSDNSFIKVSGVFYPEDYKTDTNIFENLNIEIDNNYLVVNKDMMTSVDGLYASGDIIKKDLYQLVTASSEAAIAVLSVKKKIDNEK